MRLQENGRTTDTAIKRAFLDFQLTITTQLITIPIMKKPSEYIYVAAGLFNANTNMFNAYLTKQLEESLDYQCFLPQRDGFETGKMIPFFNTIKDELGLDENADPKKAEELATAIARYVPYYLDLGYFLSRSVAIVAILDEPIDVGLVVEISYAAICNIPVIGVRTDLRTPLGNMGDTIGINPFPVEQCDCFIKADTPAGDYDQVMETTDSLTNEIKEKLEEWIPKKKNNMMENENPIFQDLIKGSEMLFWDIGEDRHTRENMLKIAHRFRENKEFLLSIVPQLVKIESGAFASI